MFLGMRLLNFFQTFSVDICDEQQSQVDKHFQTQLPLFVTFIELYLLLQRTLHCKNKCSGPGCSVVLTNYCSCQFHKTLKMRWILVGFMKLMIITRFGNINYTYIIKISKFTTKNRNSSQLLQLQLVSSYNQQLHCISSLQCLAKAG